jgi:hypothetical protein
MYINQTYINKMQPKNTSQTYPRKGRSLTPALVSVDLVPPAASVTHPDTGIVNSATVYGP